MLLSSNAMLYAIPGILLVIALALCGVSTFNFRKEKLSLYLAIRGGAITMITVLALAIQNLVGINAISGTTTFIIIALAIQIFSEILSALPTKNNMFEAVYSGLDMASAIMIALASLLIVPVSAYGLPIGFGAGLIISIIVALAIRKFDWRVDLFKYASLSITAAILAQIVIIFMNTISIQTILFAIGCIVYVVSVVLKLFFKDKSNALSISRDILYYLSMLLITSSIFMLIF